MEIRSFLPPVVVDAALAATRSRVGFTGYSTDFDEVAANCSGYESESVIASYRAAASRRPGLTRGSNALDARQVRLVGAVAQAIALQAKGEGLRILDFGGAHGAQYDALRAVFGERIGSYTIVESPAVTAGLADLGDDVLSWTSSTPEDLPRTVGSVDVAIASSTIQYLPNPELVTQSLAAIAPFVVLDRLPLIDHYEHFVMQQHTRYGGKAVTYPAWFLSRERFHDFLDLHDLRIVSEWQVPEDAPFVLRRRRPNAGMLIETPLAAASAARR